MPPAHLRTGWLRSVASLYHAFAAQSFADECAHAAGRDSLEYLVLSGNFNGNVAGTFQLNIQSGTPSGNVFTVQGTVKDNMIVGTWTLVGVTSGCAGSGNFTMKRM